MKAVMISIRPEWCEKILNKEKTVEIRKTKPKIETPFKCYIYCTKPRRAVYHNGYPCCYEDDLAVLDKAYRGGSKKYGNPWGFLSENEEILTGKVVAEFTCEHISEYYRPGTSVVYEYLSRLSCVPLDQMAEYANGKNLFGWHISNLKIYRQPKSLSDFHAWGYNETKNSVYGWTDEEEISWKLKRAPQSWCYVEELEGEEDD